MTAPNTITETAYAQGLVNEFFSFEGAGSGCCLHVVFDGNYGDNFIHHAVKLAKHRGHKECERVARILYTLSLTQRKRVGRSVNLNFKEEKKPKKSYFFTGNLKSHSENGVREWFRSSWEAGNAIDHFDIIAAHEEPDDYDGYAWGLLRERKSGLLFEVSGSHGSDYDTYDGQFAPKKTSIAYIISGHFFAVGLDIDRFRKWFLNQLEIL